MEFDASVKLIPRGEVTLDFPGGFDHAAQKVWDAMEEDATHVGEAGRGEFWGDYSTTLTTRYVVCNVESAGPSPGEESQDSMEGPYTVRFRSGRKPSYLGDAILMISLIGAFWCLSKIIVPSPPIGYILGMAAFAILAIAIIAICGKAFGEEQCAQIRERLENGPSSPGDKTEKNIQHR